MQLYITPLCALTSLFLILLPLMNTTSKGFPLQTKRAISSAFFISLIPLFSLIDESFTNNLLDLNWVNLEQTKLTLCFQFDKYSIIFTPIALFVTWSILQFSLWYMNSDPNMNTFFKYLLIFLLAMITLVSAGNLLLLFIGWEGVGIMSFLLIGWFHARSNAATAALQAMLYNRVGDIGFFTALAWLMVNAESINLQPVLTTNTPLLVTFGFIIAAASKSAQFTLHPWLASAMEGPTPVSALLHSSTMVVAGIFLMVRVHPLIAQNQMTLTTCLCLGAISTAYAATSALLQNDMKKIIAYSTSSQLGLMMVAIGINMPHLAFLHICTHAFFKALLFLCSGYIIHTLNDEQDIRKMGGLQHNLPVTSICLAIGSLALMGTPFMAGFFSKDAIIEATTTSHLNALALWLTIVATAFTAVYSLRLIFFTAMSSPRTHHSISLKENNPLVFFPLMRLACGSIIAGPLIYQLIMPDHMMTHTMPLFMKLTALITTIIALIVAYDMTTLNSSHPSISPHLKNLDTDFYSFIVQRISSAIFLDIAFQFITHAVETIALKKLFPETLQEGQLLPSKISRASQSGAIKLYLSTLYISLVLALILASCL
uniref:NADH-ubiquinone oxidoreductase chain 5 n=1 Tax=Phrynobatrachus keniensis TaxID=467738 RepID=S4V2A5_9NEOB|nr:NADH dehydrogenase subunit 5 [Phrynobatrachus keniensis]